MVLALLYMALRGRGQFLSLMPGLTVKYAPPKTSLQEKRKIPAVPNGTAAHGEAEPHGGHSGPELQRTGRLVRTACMGPTWCVVLICRELLFLDLIYFILLIATL